MPEPAISSRHNPRLKLAAKLRESRQRRATGRLLVDGARESLRALEAGVEGVEAFVDVEAAGDRVSEALEELQRRGVPILTTSHAAFEKLAFGERVDGVVLVAQAKQRTLDQLKLSSEPLIVVIEGVEKPGNLGAILRTADGAGVDGVIVVDPRVDLFNPNAIRASVGAVFRANIAVATAHEARKWLQSKEVSLFATRPKAKRLYTEADMRGAAALILGSEAEGLSPAWDSSSVQAIALPMLGIADSLNVSAAAAVLLYEARRQRLIASET